MNSNCSNLLYLRNLQEQIRKALLFQRLFLPFIVWRNCSNDLKNSRPSALNFKSFSQSLEQFFLTVGQNNFGNKIPCLRSITHHFKGIRQPQQDIIGHLWKDRNTFQEIQFLFNLFHSSLHHNLLKYTTIQRPYFTRTQS